MPLKKIIYFILLLLLPGSVYAETAPVKPLAPLNFKGIYSFGYAGVGFGKAGVEISQTPENTHMTSDIVSTGILNLFIRHSSHTVVSAKGAAYADTDVDYETHYQTKKKRKYAHLVYKNGAVVDEQVLPPDDREKRPAVTKVSKDKSVDPLSLGRTMRQKLYDNLQAGAKAFSLYLYDGRRFSQINFSIIGNKTIPFNGADTAVVQVDVTRILLEGYSQSELADAKKKEPPLRVYFSRDERLIPLLLEAPLWLGSVQAKLTHECDTGESCLFGISE